MSQIKQIGTYRGLKLDSGVSKSSGGHIQLVAQFIATECYDFETGEWITDWQQYDEQYGSEITAYLMLFSKDTSKEAFQTAKQLQKAWGWSGNSFAELEQLEPEPFQFKVIEDEFEGKKRLKVAWIDSYDATPGGVIQKLDESELKKLDAQYANALRKLGGGPKPKSVPTTNKPAKPPIPGQKTEVATDDTKVTMKEQYEQRKVRGKKAEEKAAKEKDKKKPAKPAMPPAPKPAPAPVTEPEPEAEAKDQTQPLDANQAWEETYKAKPGKVTDVQIGQLWVSVVEELGGEDAVEDWAVVRDIVIEKMSEER